MSEATNSSTKDKSPMPSTLQAEDDTADSVSHEQEKQSVTTPLPMTDEEGQVEKPVEAEEKFQPGWRFWAIFPALCLTACLSAMEGTVITTALPSIARELALGDDYIWVANGFFITGTAVTPLFGQLANVYGRRWIMIGTLAVFVLGNGICGGASSGGMLIAGRCVMGIGTGGLTMMLELIVSDLVPVRKRSAFMGLVFAAVNVGTALGPFVGGKIVASTTWRWVFYMNLPIGGAALLLMVAVLKTKYRPQKTLMAGLARIDYVGNLLIICSAISVLFALTYGGARYPWGSWHVVVPLVLGIAGFVVFFLYEAFVPKEPVMPLRIFSNRTSAIALFLTFVFSLLNLWRIYFLSVYFQSTLLSSPARAGVQILPSVLMLIPAVVIAGAIVNKTGKYLLVHYIGFAMLVLGQGLLIILGSNSPPAAWIIIQMVVAFGSSFVVGALLPAVQAPLPESDAAVATATAAFLRAFGVVWGVSVPAVIFNNRFDQIAGRITDATVRATFIGGKAYERASKDYITQYSEPTRGEIVSCYQDSLRRCWEVSVAFAGIALLAVFLEKQVTMRTKLDTEYGLEDEKTGKDKKLEKAARKEISKSEVGQETSSDTTS